ncbi:hypothetical protein EKK58_02500 [Candidatus Dependentiae bacterium]|nr:MAG: hypothetical protein EKK58_02500 [Candidatus Dependentiae bacterium]
MAHDTMFCLKVFFFSNVYFLAIQASYGTLLRLHPVTCTLPTYMVSHLKEQTVKKYTNNSGAWQELLEQTKNRLCRNLEDAHSNVGVLYNEHSRDAKNILNVDSKKAYGAFIEAQLQQKLFNLGITNNNTFLARLALDTQSYMTEKNALNIIFSKDFSDDQCKYLSGLLYAILEASSLEKIPKIYQITTAKTDPLEMPGATTPSLKHPNNAYDILLSQSLDINELTAIFVHEVGHLLDLHPHLLRTAHQVWNEQRSILGILWNHKKFDRLHNSLKQVCEMIADTKVILSLHDTQKALDIASCMIEAYLIRLLCEKIKHEESGDSYNATNVFTNDDKDTHPTWGLRIAYMLKLFDLLKAEYNSKMPNAVPLTSAAFVNNVMVEPVKNVLYKKSQEYSPEHVWKDYIANGLAGIDSILQDALSVPGIECVLQFVLRDFFDYTVKNKDSVFLQSKNFMQWLDKQRADEAIDFNNMHLLEGYYYSLDSYLNELIINIPGDSDDREKRRCFVKQFNEQCKQHLLSVLNKKCAV